MNEVENQIIQHSYSLAERKDNVLYRPCRLVENSEINTDVFQNFLKSMKKTMNDLNGIGIAANQIGKSLQVFMIEAKSTNPRYSVLGEVPFQIFMNPRIVNASETIYNFWHGCLSAQGEKRGNVATYEWIEYECVNENGQRKSGKLYGLASVIFQHEFRHLLGGTYLDFAKNLLSKEELEDALENKEVPFFEKSTPGALPHLLGDYYVGEFLEAAYLRMNTKLK